MNFRRILCWAALFTCLLLSVLFFERQPREVHPPATEQSQPRVFTCNEEQVQEITVIRGAQQLRLIRNGRDWRTEPDCTDRISKDHIKSFITALLETTQIDTVGGAELSREPFGLMSPWARIVLRCEANEEPVELELGAMTPSNISLYASLKGSDRVILIGTYLRFSLNILFDSAGLK
ncbi:MAG: DUF4340 domain-containing protein [Desulfobacterota bacterium]|nr:DUF4340 domain-containing protein [Thermodesulfobacteriota bacterium]